MSNRPIGAIESARNDAATRTGVPAERWTVESDRHILASQGPHELTGEGLTVSLSPVREVVLVEGRQRLVYQERRGVVAYQAHLSHVTPQAPGVGL